MSPTQGPTCGFSLPTEHMPGAAQVHAASLSVKQMFPAVVQPVGLLAGLHCSPGSMVPLPHVPVGVKQVHWPWLPGDRQICPEGHPLGFAV